MAEMFLPELGLLRRYLGAHGWSRDRLRGGALDLFSLPASGAGPAIEIVLPHSSGTVDEAARISQALRTLAALDGRAEREVGAEIAMLDFDIIKARFPDEAVLRDSIRLSVADKFLGNTRRLLAASAAAELHDNATGEDARRAGQEYVSECRLGHTFRGSFGFTIESPAGPFSPVEEKTPPPPQRRIVERLARGLATIELATVNYDPEVLVKNASVGFDFGMLDGFAALLEESTASRLLFNFVLTPAWPHDPNLPTQTQVSTSALPLIEQASKALMPVEKAEVETVLGTIIKLETRDTPADLFHVRDSREVTIEGVSLRKGMIRLKVRLAPAEYLVALEAHRDGKRVIVSGKVQRSSRGNTLIDPHDFSVRND